MEHNLWPRKISLKVTKPTGKARGRSRATSASTLARPLPLSKPSLTPARNTASSTDGNGCGRAMTSEAAGVKVARCQSRHARATHFSSSAKPLANASDQVIDECRVQFQEFSKSG